MMTYARMDASDGVTVVEVFPLWDGPPIEKYLYPTLVPLFHLCPENVQVGWIWNQDEDTYSPPPGV